MLAELGLKAIETASGPEALGLLADGAGIDPVGRDHLMPGMTDAELAEAIRALRPDIPILSVSGYSDLASILVNLPRLAKPFGQVELASSVSALLHGSSSSRKATFQPV